MRASLLLVVALTVPHNLAHAYPARARQPRDNREHPYKPRVYNARDYHVGDRGAIYIPVDNTTSLQALTNAQITIQSSPGWVQVLTTSMLGPTTIAAGTSYQFEIDYKVIIATAAVATNFSYQFSASSAPGTTWALNCAALSAAGQSGGGCTDSSGTTLTYNPLPDTTPPQSTATFSMAPYIDAQGNAYLSPDAFIWLSATDPMLPFSVTSGSPAIYVATGSSHATLGPYMTYDQAISLSTGNQTLSFYSTDAAGNTESLHELSFFIAGTPPITQLVVAGTGSIATNGNIILDPASAVQLNAAASVPSAYPLGISRTLASIDSNAIFVATEPITFSTGAHVLRYLSIDNVENAEQAHQLSVFVGVAADTTPPTTQLFVGSNAVTGTGVIGNLSSISLLSSDNPGGVGVAQINYFVDVDSVSCPGAPAATSAPGSCSNSVYISSFTLNYGTHTVIFSAIDFAGNMEPYKTVYLAPRSGSPPSIALSGAVVSSATIRWSWTLTGAPASLSLFTSSGAIVADPSVLGTSATYYLETGLAVATSYSRYLEAQNGLDQLFSSTVTVATPGAQAFVSGSASSTLTGSDGQKELDIPLADLGTNVEWLLSEDPANRPLIGDAPALIAAASLALPAGLGGSANSLTEFIVAIDGSRSTATLPSPLTIKVPYPDANNDGIVDGTSPPIPASTLKLYVLNENTAQWEEVPGSRADTTNHLVVGQIGHLSIFNAFGAGARNDLSAVRVYPVPFKPNSGDPNQGVPYSPGNLSSGIIFDNLPAQVTIRIYTATGQLVAEFGSSNSMGLLQWDVKNADGRDAASGGYLAVITSPGQKRIVKKLLVIR